MKIKHLLIGLFAVAAAVACKQEEPLATPKLDVDKTAVQVAATAGEATFNVTTNQDWTASPDADWVSVDPATGKGSEKAVAVKVTAEDNTSEEPRTAKITVKAGELTKTVSVTQAGATNTEPGPGPEPGPDAETYLLVGDAVGGWSFDNPVVLTLTEGYYVAKEVGVQGEKDMHFTKNSSWEGNVKGLAGRIAPNEIGEVGNNNISLTVGGAYDIYLAETLDKFYFMTPGKTPAEAVEHVEIATVWGVCGAIEGNSWGASKDPVLAQEGEWFVAKGVTFTEVNFKVRGNNTWADDLKWGRASKDQPNGNLHEAIAVSTCSEYIAANEGEGDNPNIYVGAAAGNYDVYFSPEKKEVWVMLEGYKPGDDLPEMEKTWGVIGVNGDWSSDVEMTLEGDYYVAKNVKYNDDAAVEFKIRANKAWVDDTNMGLDKDVPWGAVNTAIPVVSATTAKANGASDAGNIGLADVTGGTYDIYFDLAGLKVWVMTPGLKPGETPAAGDFDIDGKQWTFAWQAMGGASCVIDLGVTEPGVAILAYDMAILDPSYAGIYYPYMQGTYTIAKTDGTSGVVTLSADGKSVEIPYSNATENTVHFESAALLEGENIDCTLATSLIEISTGAAEGLADGEYWIIADGKVATPLTGNYGYLNVVDAVDGKSTAANAFTFTQVDAGVYTIQDSNGKYYYQTGTYNSFNVADKDGGTDEYLWEVYDSGNGTFVIMNYGVGKFMQYDSSYNSYGSYEDERGVLPTLVLAEDPIAEPEPEEPSGDAAKFATNVTCTTVSSAYTDGVATVNGVADVFTLKLGTSKLYGEAKITLPAGTTKVSYYAVGWKGKASKLEFSVGGTVVATQAVAANDGATSTSPYTITVTDSDHYTITLPAALEADTEVTVKTVETGYRAIAFGIQAE